MKKAVIFDMDGLMFDTETLYFKANQKTAEKVEIPFDYSFYENYIGASDEDFFAGMYESFEKEKVDLFLELSGVDVENELFSTPPKLKEGLLSLLDYLKENNYILVVASSSKRFIVEKMLKNANLTSYFSAVVGGDEVIQSKPHPEIFKKAAALTGVESSQILILEDSLNGVRSAYAAGIDVVMIPDLLAPDNEAREKTLEICNDLHEIIIKLKRDF